MILRILLLVQVLIGAMGYVAVRLLQVSNLSLWTGLCIALIITGSILFVIDFVRRSRKLSDKEKRTVVGVIERKAELRRQRRKNAGYHTFLASGYAFVIAFLTAYFAKLPLLYLQILGVELFGQLILFWILYQIERIRPEDD